MNFKSEESLQKLRGGYYTPEPIAAYLSKWALEGGGERILEPSCGDGRFLAAIHKLTQEGSVPIPQQVDAVELIPHEAKQARVITDLLREQSIKAQVVNSDFFKWANESVNGSKWDAVVGNPPYIRYQYFESEQRDLAELIFKKANVPFTKRTNAWVPFLIASIMHLNPSGRLAMVVPAEILHIQHANGLRLLLEQEMESVTLIHFREIVFSETLQGVVLLLATKRRERSFKPLGVNGKQLGLFSDQVPEPVNLNIIDVKSWHDLQNIDLRSVKRQVTVWNGKWMLALLSDDEISLLQKLDKHTSIKQFKEVAEVDIGIVTGANKFFVVDDSTLAQYQLEDIGDPMLAKSELIQGITYKAEDHFNNRLRGKPVHFLQFPDQPKANLPSLMKKYIEYGEEQNLHTRYKCRIREPWYVVPYVWVSEVSLLKRCHKYPRLVLNELGAYSTDTAYRIRVTTKEHSAKSLVGSFINSLTFLYAELLGRHYGGGVLELVPSEVEELRLPTIEIDDETFNTLDNLIRKDASLDELVNFADAVILEKGLGLTPDVIKKIRFANERLRSRRLRIEHN